MINLLNKFFRLLFFASLFIVAQYLGIFSSRDKVNAITFYIALTIVSSVFLFFVYILIKGRNEIFYNDKIILTKDEIIISSKIKENNITLQLHDFSEPLTWDEANHKCGAIGREWRLPTIDELNYIFSQKQHVLVFVNNYYWSSTPGENDEMMVFHFESGVSFSFKKSGKLQARAIKKATPST